MADLPNILIFLVPYTLGIIYLRCWHNFLKDEDPEHPPGGASRRAENRTTESSHSHHGALSHG